MGLSADDKLLVERIEMDFDYRAPKDGTGISARAKELARQIIELCPNGRERSKALTKLEECIFWTNAAIARRETE